VKELTPQEDMNLKAFSCEYAVKELYNAKGFTGLEKYLVDKYFKAGSRILDIGCGTGRTTAPLKDMGMDVIGIDLSPDMIRSAGEKRTDIDYRVMNACELEFADASFDHVLFSFNGIDCIHPEEKREECLKEVFRVLKNGGTFIFSSHNALGIPRNRESMKTFLKNLLSLRVFGHYREEDSPSGKLYLYYGVPAMEKKMLSRLGFEVMEVTGKQRKIGFCAECLELGLYYAVKKI
jgi:ubiquinone/menaquinone biosynthesis C-methylase UbiE